MIEKTYSASYEGSLRYT